MSHCRPAGFAPPKPRSARPGLFSGLDERLSAVFAERSAKHLLVSPRGLLWQGIGVNILRAGALHARHHGSAFAKRCRAILRVWALPRPLPWVTAVFGGALCRLWWLMVFLWCLMSFVVPCCVCLVACCFVRRVVSGDFLVCQMVFCAG